MREYAVAHNWRTIIRLPSYAPNLNPVEGVWSLLRHDRWPIPPSPTTRTLRRTLHRGLRHIQLRPDLIDGCLPCTRLILTQQPTKSRGSQ
ncbi:hypothetical protein ABZZ74_53205 [Streptomyces sp. NPDC006476]|uniref:hypothetical protein n=1 Tax=Streptomyces sp. NPDC006476 TaxID=3157175 RepID=UPI0033BBC14E